MRSRRRVCCGHSYRHIDADQYSLKKTITALVRQSGFGRANGDSMNGPLTGCLVLIAEDEPLIALDMTLAFEDEGAWVTRARTLNEALIGIEDRALSVAILDHALSDGDSLKVYARLKERNIPFVTYSGCDDLGCGGGVHVKKPASMSVLVTTVRDLLAHHAVSGAAASPSRTSLSQRATRLSPRR
jgi:DNA-binding response OmpR family regulator